ncbi:protein of unknown function [Candidatus Nitrosacidococcus tergens]|uniref:Uncharacterized protein n=1 Tax=Candidatus Nitrosacidococcus tergens TaxID=553981 RepID=A0A7G1Q952_9GAMM|nr:protein of unknown function [Candidatus Nitrosacidococcus tergens]
MYTYTTSRDSHEIANGYTASHGDQTRRSIKPFRKYVGDFTDRIVGNYLYI